MARIRVGQLAKELNIKVSEAVARLRQLGAEVKSNLSTVDEETAARLRSGAAPLPAAPAKPAKSAATRSSMPAGGAVRPAAAGTAARKPAAQTAPPKTPSPGGGGGPKAVPVSPLRPPSSGTAPRGTSVATPSAAPGQGQPVKGHAAPTVGSPAAPSTTRPPVLQPRAVPPQSRPISTPVASPRPGVPGFKPATPGAIHRPPAPASVRPTTVRTVPGTGAARVGAPPLARPTGTVPGVGQKQGTPAPRPTSIPPAGARAQGAASAVTPAQRSPAGARPTTPPTTHLRPVVPGQALKRPLPAPPPRQTQGTQQTPRPASTAPAPIRAAAPPPPPVPEVLTEMTITEGVTVKELSEKMDRKAKDIITKLIGRGILATINQPLDTSVAKEICRELGFDAKVITFEEEVAIEQAQDSVAADLKPRDPVVTIMGHVDHGKTSLLDAIRESNIIASEAGGITQHIGAYHIRRKNRGITFIDTPGHEAFTMMRARGARVTDIVILVVAADDGVMPQTVEAIHHARAAGVPQVIAINKIDKPGANLDRVKKQLSDQGLLVEDWGGDVVAVPISAKQRTGIDELLEMILLVADMADLKADATSFASGTVLDARLDRSRGPVATILVQRGTLSVGDPFIAGAIHGKVRAMFDDLGHRLREAGPSIPAEVLGLEGVPRAGDLFQVLEEEWKVRQIGAFRQQKLRQEAMAKSSRLTLDHLYQQIKEGMVKELPVVVKADVQGSVEALAKSLADLPSEKVKIRVIHAGSGAITETDVHLASASNAIIVGYNVRPERSAQELAEKEKVDIRLHSVIYDITSEIKNAMVGLLEPESKEVYLGRAEVRQVFKVPKVGAVAGCLVADGRIARNAEARLLRDNVVVYTGKVASLRRFKDDASEVKAGYECGIGLANYNDVKTGDVIEAFRVEKVAVKSL
jgi:translation initiation factor IF-2